jgi:hypothetical protein
MARAKLLAEKRLGSTLALVPIGGPSPPYRSMQSKPHASNVRPKTFYVRDLRSENCIEFCWRIYRVKSAAPNIQDRKSALFICWREYPMHKMRDYFDPVLRKRIGLEVELYHVYRTFDVKTKLGIYGNVVFKYPAGGSAIVFLTGKFDFPLGTVAAEK